jgi:hypothetical protein
MQERSSPGIGPSKSRRAAVIASAGAEPFSPESNAPVEAVN